MSIGIKGFLNQWSHEAEDDNDPDTGSKSFSGSKTGFIMGPSLKMSYKNFFGGIGYLTSVQSYKKNMTLHETDHYVYDRQDLDFIAGYMLHPRFGLFAGLKYLIYEGYNHSVEIVDYDNNIYSDYISGNCKFTGEQKSIGPALGITANYPFFK